MTNASTPPATATAPTAKEIHPLPLDCSCSWIWISKKYFSWTDTYGVDISRGEDEILILASAVVVDLCCHEKRS